MVLQQFNVKAFFSLQAGNVHKFEHKDPAVLDGTSLESQNGENLPFWILLSWLFIMILVLAMLTEIARKQ